MTQTASTPLVTVDIGNTSIHCGLFEAPRGETPGALPRPVRQLNLATTGEEFASLAEWLPNAPVRWLVASVHRATSDRLQAWVRRERSDSAFHLLRATDLPLAIEVDFPERVGMDRLVGAVAANRLRAADRPAIVIDAGTAITVDLVGIGGAFLGGAILPGMSMSARSLSEQTDQLPLVLAEADQPPPAVGKNTAAAIRSGLYWGTVGALRQLVVRIGHETPGQPHIFLTGGDALKMAPLLDLPAETVPHLVLAGIAVAAEALRELAER